ncbi:hypothetical protein Tco_0904917 [Tanacetum coccineum]
MRPGSGSEDDKKKQSLHHRRIRKDYNQRSIEKSGYRKDGDGDGNFQPHKGVKASANSDVKYSFTSAQDGEPLQDDVRLCLGNDLKKAQDHIKDCACPSTFTPPAKKETGKVRILVWIPLHMLPGYGIQALEINLELLEEKREQAAIREAKSKRQMEKYYNTKVRNASFKPGDLVYRSNEASRVEDTGKLGPKWEGPYEVTEALGKGSYKLKDRNGRELPRTWNICNLKKCYINKV